jgi:hypothetical protein
MTQFGKTYNLYDSRVKANRPALQKWPAGKLNNSDYCQRIQLGYIGMASG